MRTLRVKPAHDDLSRCDFICVADLANGAPAPFTVMVTTSDPAALPPSVQLRFPPITVPLLLLSVFALLLVISLIHHRPAESASGRTHWTFSGVLAVLLCTLALCDVAGCGGGTASIAPPPLVITPSGNSTITVTPSATSSTGQPLQLSPIQLTLTVKQHRYSW